LPPRCSRLPAVLFADVVESGYIGMAQRGDRLRLAMERRSRLGRFKQLAGEKLERHKPVQSPVPRLVYTPHASLADETEEFVVRSALPYTAGRHDAPSFHPAGVNPSG
jgi:hypothetical protein